MNRPAPKPAELALPVASLHALRERLGIDVGPDATAHALRAAGYAAGDAMFAAMTSSAAGSGTDLGDLGTEAYWRRFADFFAGRGWGRLRFRLLHEGVATLESDDWAEADQAAGAARPSCYLTTGVLANLLGRTAGREVAVLEVQCRCQGASHCVFVFGAPDTLTTLHADLAAGADLEQALLELV